MSETEEINDFATRVLFSRELSDKLRTPLKLTDHQKCRALEKVPSRPSRSQNLDMVKVGGHRRSKRDLNPTLDHLSDPIFRGRVLHTFAHHELISLELMALALLRFPEAPKPFRRGLAQVMIDEQRHFGFYHQRIKSLGLSLGEEPVSDYFWRCVADAPDIISFNARLGLVFEQANIDFTRHYAPLFRKVGDEESACFLDQIYKDEISHVGIGLHWFRKWRPNNEPEWDSFCKLLEPPLSPGRAKGNVFSVEGRREAGFSEEYIQSLKLWGGSTGRPPIVWLGNFDFEDELLDLAVINGHLPIDQSPKRRKKRRGIRTQARHGLTPLLGWLSTRGDIIYCPYSKPSTTFQNLMLKARGVNPEWVTDLSCVIDRKLGGVRPWGWSERAYEHLRPLKSSILETGLMPPNSQVIEHLRGHASKFWSFELQCSLKKHLMDQNEVCPLYFHPKDQHFIWNSQQDLQTLRERLLKYNQEAPLWVFKRPFGHAGRGLKKVRVDREFDQPTLGWLKRSLPMGVTAEPWLNRIVDISFHGDVTANTIIYDGEVVSVVDGNGRFNGSYLGPPMSVVPQNIKRFFSGEGRDRRRLSRLGKGLIEFVGNRLQQAGIYGAFGVDAMVIKDQKRLALYPLVEVNPRITMGRLALKLRKCFDPRGQHKALIKIFPSIEMVPEEIKTSLKEQMCDDLFDERGEWQGGVLPLSDYWAIQHEKEAKLHRPLALLISS